MANVIFPQQVPSPNQFGGPKKSTQAQIPTMPQSTQSKDLRSKALGDFHQRALRITGDPEAAQVMTAVAAREGGLTGNIGDVKIGGSFGPLQFYTKGQLPAFARAMGVPSNVAAQMARDPAQWDKVIQFAWNNYLGDMIRQGRARGLSGPALATFASQHGQRSVHPEESGRQYAMLFGGAAPHFNPQTAHRQGIPTPAQPIPPVEPRVTGPAVATALPKLPQYEFPDTALPSELANPHRPDPAGLLRMMLPYLRGSFRG